jgi:hypothetical protein
MHDQHRAVEMIWLTMIILHSGTGTPIDLNTQTITNMRNPEPHNRLFTGNVKCVVNMTDGKYVTVKETCEQVRKLMETTK